MAVVAATCRSALCRTRGSEGYGTHRLQQAQTRVFLTVGPKLSIACILGSPKEVNLVKDFAKAKTRLRGSRTGFAFRWCSF